jgi:LacI family transcriptional regulator
MLSSASPSGPARPTEPSVAILVETGSSWGRRLVSGILDYSRQQGRWHVHIEPIGPGESALLPTGWRGDGVIARINSPVLHEQLKELGIPAVNTSAMPIAGDEYPRITSNFHESAQLAASLFWSRGFTRFVYMGDANLPYVNDQIGAFAQVLAKRDQTCLQHNPVESVEALAEWMQTLPKPIAVYCWGPSIGRKVIDACRIAGIRVPHDVAVLGADYDDLLSEASYPPQSGIRLAAEQIGMTAAALLDGMMQGRKPEKMQWVIPPLGVIEKLSTDTMAVADRRMGEVMRYIITHFPEPISVTDILRANPMCRRSLESKFRQTFGCSVAEQIRQIRVNRARLLLATTDEPVTLIAEKCGFSTYNYMGRVFQADTGMSPREYRMGCRVRRS